MKTIIISILSLQSFATSVFAKNSKAPKAAKAAKSAKAAKAAKDKKTTYVANFDEDTTNISGSFRITIDGDGSSSHKFDIDLNNFESYNGCDLSLGLSYHIHSYWPKDGSSAAVGDECGGANTGGHYDPFLGCGKATSSTTECGLLGRTASDDYSYMCSPDIYSQGDYQCCEVGDLSGKFGNVMPKSADDLVFKCKGEDPLGPLASNFCVPETGIIKSWESIVFHCPTDGSRQFCAKFEKM